MDRIVNRGKPASESYQKAVLPYCVLTIFARTMASNVKRLVGMKIAKRIMALFLDR
jgi:hypothetical protein